MKCTLIRSTDWKRQLSDRAAKVFGKISESNPPVDVKAMHAKIGQLTLENDFLHHPDQPESELEHQQGVQSGNDIVEHDAEAAVQMTVNPVNREGLPYIKKTK